MKSSPLDQSSGFAETSGTPFAALSRFTVANDMMEEVKSAFRRRPHLVDQWPGFVRMEVLSPTNDSQEIWLLTFWNDEASYRSWHRGHTYRDSHAGIPKGLKLVPGRTSLTTFLHVCS